MIDGTNMRLLAAGTAVLLLGIAASPTLAEDPEISARRAAERRDFTDQEIIDGFFKIAFGAELQLQGRVDRIRKYDGPVRVYIDNRGRPDRSADVAAVVDDIRTRVANLDIAVIKEAGAANVVV